MQEQKRQPEPERSALIKERPITRLWWFAWPMYTASLIWAFAAIHFDGPVRGANLPIACAWLTAAIAALALIRNPKKRLAAWAIAFGMVALPWLLKKPSNDRNWASDWRQLGHIEIDGDLVVIHNYRNFDWTPDGSVTERWQTKRVHLSNLRAVDYFQDNFGGDLWAHPMVSFDFGPDGYVAMSIEARREVGEAYSPIAGLFKTYELQYVFADERDVILTRTNIRNEPVYLYRTAFSPKGAREFFLESVTAHNALRKTPEFYHSVGANCTTSLRRQAPKERHRPLDKRMLLNGRLDEMLVELGQLETAGHAFERLRPKMLINEAAQTAHDDPNFSTRIRAGRPGFQDAKKEFSPELQTK